MKLCAAVIFVATYLGLALGRVPGLRLDRTGFALLGAVAALAAGCITLAEAEASVDVPTLCVLFGMMVLSAQYRLSGLYTAISDRVARVRSPRRLLLMVVLTSASLSAVLTNDVVCLALTPLLGTVLLGARLPPLPYLLALACASNIGSALTPIGNPQNILIAQSLGLGFAGFVAFCALPALLALGFLYLFLARRVDPVPGAPAMAFDVGDARRPFDRWQARKAIALTAVAIGLFLSPVPAWLTALGVAGLCLTSRRMHTHEMLALVDWQLLVLFIGLFVVLGSLEKAGWTADAAALLAARGIDPMQPLILVPLVAMASNLVSNVPAVMLLLPFTGGEPAHGPVLALASTLAGNAFVVSSIANIIVVQQAARLGIAIGFREHARVGVPVTLVSLALTLAWALVAGG